MKITEMIKTIDACPTLWECKLDGKPAYIKFRWGYLAVKLDEGKALWNTEIAGEQLSDGLDGVIDEDRVIIWLLKNGFECD